jgi:hypothetical protein
LLIARERPQERGGPLSWMMREPTPGRGGPGGTGAPPPPPPPPGAGVGPPPPPPPAGGGAGGGAHPLSVPSLPGVGSLIIQKGGSSPLSGVPLGLHRLAPLWIGARGLEFTWEYIFQGIEANANLVMTLSLAALGSLMWLRKNKPRTLVPIIYACALLLATMPSITSYLRRSLEWQTPKVVGFELFSSLVMAFISWQLFSACQRPT